MRLFLVQSGGGVEFEVDEQESFAISKPQGPDQTLMLRDWRITLARLWEAFRAFRAN